MNQYALITSFTWREPVADQASLPSFGNSNGDARVTLDDSSVWIWNVSSWSQVSGGGGTTDSFSIMQPDNGTSPTASSPTDTLSLTSSDKTVDVTGNSSTDTIDFRDPSNVVLGNSGSSLAIDWQADGPVQEVTLDDDCTITLSNPRAGVVYVLKITQDGTGGWTVTWPADVRWLDNNTAPVITPTADRTDLINLYYDGARYLGSYAQDYDLT